MEVDQKDKKYILHEDLTKVMWKLSLPAIAAMVLFGLNAFMDTVYVGQLLEQTALAGVSLAYPLTAILLGIGTWVGTGAGNKISILLGEHDLETAAKVIPNAQLFTLIISFITAVLLYVFAPDLIQLMGGCGEVLVYGTTYLRISALATPFWVFALQYNFIIRSEGKMKTAAAMMAYGLFANIILTPIFITYLDMGVAGAAWATNIGMFIYCGVGYFYFLRGKNSFPANIHSIKYDANVFKSIVQLGFPGMIMSIMNLIQAVVVLNVISRYGNTFDLAFYAAVVRIQMLLLTPLFGLMRALQPVAGVNFGARNYRRTISSYWLFGKVGFLMVLPLTVLILMFPSDTLSLVLPNTSFKADDIWNIRIFILITPFLSFVFMALTFLPAIEKPKHASIIGLARQLVFYIPIMLLLPKWIGLSGIYYGSTAIDIIITIWLMWIIAQNLKRLKKLSGQPIKSMT